MGDGNEGVQTEAAKDSKAKQGTKLASSVFLLECAHTFPYWALTFPIWLVPHTGIEAQGCSEGQRAPTRSISNLSFSKSFFCCRSFKVRVKSHPAS